MARAGYAARGFVYLIVGALATAAAIGPSDSTTGVKGALIHLSWQPLGYIIVAGVALGLCCFAIWRIYEAITDPEGNGRGIQGLATRLGFVIEALMYLALAAYAVSLAVLGSRGESTNDDQAARDWTAWLMSQPFGPWLVMAVGIGIIGAGLFSAYYALTADFRAELTWDPRACRWAAPVCRFGLLARSLVSLLIGVFLVAAAYYYDPSHARGFVGSLAALRAQPLGPLLFGAVAVGLFAFGVYGLIEARFRKVGKFA